MDIVIPTYNGHFEYMDKFLDTFELNCEDHNEVTINLIISVDDTEIFENLSKKHPKLKIRLMIFKDLIEKYDGIKVDETELLKSVGRFNYQSIKKLFGALETNNKYVCIFDSECLFIRKFRMREYINDNKNKIMYCSKMSQTKNGVETHAKYMQRLMNDFIGLDDPNWYLETYMWIFRRDILLDLKSYIDTKCGHITQHKKDMFIEYAYYLYCQKNRIKYPEFEWTDTYTYLRNYMPKNLFQTWNDKTHQWCMFEHIGLHLKDSGYEQLEMVRMIYGNMKMPIFRLIPEDRMNVIMLILCKDIKICVSEYCPIVYSMTMKDLFNKKIGIFVSGLHRPCDGVEILQKNIYPMSEDVHCYISTNEPTIYRDYMRLIPPKTIIIDNAQHTYDTSKIKYKQQSKPELIGNTIEMFYKRSQLVGKLDSYDIIVHTRPDLVSLDKRIIDLIYDTYCNYDEGTIYTPIVYGSQGIADTFAIGSRRVMKCYMSIHSSLDKLVDKCIFNPELLTYFHVISNNIRLYPITWNYRINWHPMSLMNVWWRIDASLNITPDIFEEYLKLKTTSHRVIYDNFLTSRRSYTIMNAETKYYLHVPETKRKMCNGITISPTYSSKFELSIYKDYIHRVNIKLVGVEDNLNRDGTGWNIFTVPENNGVYGYGNGGEWAQFYVEKEDGFYHFASYHSVNLKNREVGFGRYLGISDGQLVSDLAKSSKTRWIISQ